MSTSSTVLKQLGDMTQGVQAVSTDEFALRVSQAQTLMQQQGVAALYINAGTNLYYYTGIRWSASERMVGAFIPANGEIQYIVPAFEEGTFQQLFDEPMQFNTWQEHESPYQLAARVLTDMKVQKGNLAIDESTPFFIADGLKQVLNGFELINGTAITANCRMFKSATEIALIQRAMDMTLEVHKAAAAILKPGISTTEVAQFIHQAHQAVGAAKGSYFCIVLFGEASAYPHGVPYAQQLKQGDMVLIDTGCDLHGYKSDITRSYVYGAASERQKEVWFAEKGAQAAAFQAAQLGAPCGDVDRAARSYLESQGFGPDYQLPGLPHRTGHGLGLDIHEWPYLVRSDNTPLAAGMCFSNEPMICIPGEFGIRLEDHFYMTESGPRWFTQPSVSIDQPFA